jgi:hypothetical protein
VARLDRDGELAFLPFRHPEAAPFLERLAPEERFASWRLVRPDGSLAGYGTGVVPLLEAMRVTRPLARVVALVPARLLDALYGLVAKRRGALGRLVPDVPAVTQTAETARASDSTESGDPDALATSRSQRIDSPGE